MPLARRAAGRRDGAKAVCRQAVLHHLEDIALFEANVGFEEAPELRDPARRRRPLRTSPRNAA
jgi:hypothetical protein